MEDLKAAISKANPKYYPSRQRLTLPAEPGQRSGSPLLDGKALTDYKLTDRSTVIFKDLGTQASSLTAHSIYSFHTTVSIQLGRAAGWLDHSLFLGVFWSLSSVSIVLLLATAVVPRGQVRPAKRLEQQQR